MGFWIIRNKETGRVATIDEVESKAGHLFISTEDHARLVFEFFDDKWKLEHYDPWPWDEDIVNRLPTNLGPYSSGALQKDGGWWKREIKQIEKVTIHHTLSNSPDATANHYIAKGGGRPSIPYTIWITQEGRILLCAPLEWGLWHDHTGHQNVHLSVGLAGSLHLYHPAEVQLDAAAKLCAWAIKSNQLPLIKDIEDITGHRDWIATICPGWSRKQSGSWKDEFYQRVEDAL